MLSVKFDLYTFYFVLSSSTLVYVSGSARMWFCPEVKYDRASFASLML